MTNADRIRNMAMDGDLISRTALIGHIEHEYRQWGEDYDVRQILGDIEDFQAAYDINKVVGKLEDLRQKEIDLMRRHVSDASYMKAAIDHTLMVDAIEIVKSGGIGTGCAGTGGLAGYKVL